MAPKKKNKCLELYKKKANYRRFFFFTELESSARRVFETLVESSNVWFSDKVHGLPSAQRRTSWSHTVG